MNRGVKIKEREWGKSEITGPRHAFRLEMMLRETAEYLHPPATVLDAGCGDGSLTVALARKGYAMSAVDASRLCIERLLSRPVPNSPSIIAGLSYLSSLPFPGQSFDGVVSGEVFEHLDDDEAAANDVFRVLKPGGILLMTVPADPSLWSIEDEWAGHKRRYRPQGLRDLFEGAGFKVEKLHHWGWPVIYLYDRYLFRAWLKTRSDPDRESEKSIGANPFLIKAMSLVFSIDRLFMSVPKGIGLLGVFRKPS